MKCIEYKNVVLPPRKMRVCEDEFRDDDFFVDSAEAEVERLERTAGLSPETRLLEVGCGPGRLAIGLWSRLGGVKDYLGLDVNPAFIEWCREHIQGRRPEFRFELLNLRNDRYNPDGPEMGPGFSFPAADRSFDLIYLYSVFSHMVKDDVAVYLREFARVLSPGGIVFLTAFIEEDAPEMTVNPEDYRVDWKGALHCVRYNREFFDKMVREAGLKVSRFDYEGEPGGQSDVFLSLA